MLLYFMRGTIHCWAWGMLERTAGCLELGSVRRFVPGSKSMKSRRMLHSAFWNHGAMELELSPLWQVLTQGTVHNDLPIQTNEPDNSGGVMLDFLYPSGALNLIRQYSPWTPDRTEFRRPRGIGRIGQRLYTSAAGDGSVAMSRHADDFGIQEEDNLIESHVDWKVQHSKSDTTGQRSAFLQSISQSTRTNDYEEAWRQFGQLSPDNQLALAPQLLSYLITSSRPIDADRIISVFDTIKDQAGHSSYEALVNAHVILRNYEDASKVHSESLAVFRKPTASDRLLGLLIQYGRWDMAFEAWKTARDLGSAHPGNGHDIWARVAYLPNVDEKMLQMVAGLTSHLSDTPGLEMSRQLPGDKVTFITDALSIALFPQDDFSEASFLSVFSQLERLGLATESVYQNTILKLLKMDSTKLVVRLYRKFRQTDFVPTTHILDAVLKIFCKYKSNMGMHQILEDWVRYFDRPSSPAYRMVMTAFASQGNVEAIKGLWKKYLERQKHGQIRNADDLLPLMHVHAKRGEVDEVVNIFENMEAEYKVVPNIKHTNILLNAYGKAHAVDKAFEHYNKVLDSDVHPDKITIGTLMGICTQRGDAVAVRELYNSAAGLGIRPNVAMVDCLVLGDIQNDNIDRAEETCMKALAMVLDGPKTRMWNYLLVAYAMRRDLENVSRVHRIMESSNVTPDTYTYSALMQALAVAGQPSRAWKILTEVMPEAGIQATEFHYAVVMGGFIATKELDMVFHVRDHMLRRPEGLKPSFSSNIQTMKAAVMEDSRRIQSGDADKDFAKAEDYFFQFLMSADRQELASSPTKGMGHEPLDVAYSAAYFDFYMFVCGQHKAFDRVKQLYDNFLQRLPDDRRSQPPIRILNALMVSRLKENDHAGVQEAWEFALVRAKERGKPVSGDNLLLYSHRLSLCRPLSTLIKSLAAQNKFAQLEVIIADIRAFGFELDSNNWNLYVQALTNAHKYQEAFGICEKRLMPGWLGWAMIRQVEPRRNRLSLKDRARKRDPTYLRPIYHTILMLSRAYLDMEGSYSAAGQAYHDRGRTGEESTGDNPGMLPAPTQTTPSTMSTRTGKFQAFHGTFIHSSSPGSIEIVHNGVLVVGPDGRIVHILRDIHLEEAQTALDGLGIGASECHISVVSSDASNPGFLIPGFVDTHNHAPQWAQRGLGRGLQILEWLDTVTFPNEAKFADDDYARKVYLSCVDGAIKQGITTACYYGSVHGEATKILADICLDKGQRAFIGKCNMNQNSPAYYTDASANESLEVTKDFIAHVRSRDPTFSQISPIITPRFAISCTRELLKGLGEIAAQNGGLPIQTHFNEAESEIAATLSLFPEFNNEADLYAHFGLLTNRSVLAHCCHMTPYEVDRLKALDCGVAHCPIANTTVGGGFMAAPIREFLRQDIKVGLGTDSGGGFSSSILDAMRQAFIVSNAREMMTKGEDKSLSLEECFYMATLGGARVCGIEHEAGNFSVGKHFDALHIQMASVGGDESNLASTGIEVGDGMRTVFEKFMMTADDRNIARARKKFAKPPVKLACLSCRSSRIRCDGKQDCSKCLEKGKECLYTRSRRGGPRVSLHGRRSKGKPRISTVDILKKESPLSVEEQFLEAANISDTGAGLRQLDDLSAEDVELSDAPVDAGAPLYGIDHLDQVQGFPDMQFEPLGDSESSAWDSFNSASLTSGSDETSSDVRAYETDADILDAYYVYCHAYFPALPPPARIPIDRPVALGSLTGGYGPSTPLSLALSAMLALIPLPDDPDPKGENSTWNRRIQAHKFAQASFEALDNESELVDSIINPKDALSNGSPRTYRAPFHQDLPLELEANVALMVLSIYEYGQRGNMKKMLNRSGQSLMLALEAKLYSPIVDQFVEARRRVWWATYINVCEVATISGTEPAIDIRDPKFSLPYPTLAADPEAIPFFVQCQFAILDASKYANDLNKIIDNGGDLSALYMRTLDMEARLESLSQIADAWFDKTPSNMPVTSSEAVVARSLRSMGRVKINSARIKIHRYPAFTNTPIFSKLHCGLQPITPKVTSAPASTTLYNDISRDPSSQLLPGQPSSDMAHLGPGSHHMPMPSPPGDSQLPFNAPYSTNITRKAALDIAETLHALPYPNPSGLVDPSGLLSTPLSALPPRTMPTFMCCALMGAYVLTMLSYKLRAEQLESPNSEVALALSTYEDALRQGLGRILSGLENYASAFEAVDGMREEVAKAFKLSLVQTLREPDNRVNWNPYYSGLD
ncbi:hypothetical protein V495_02515 [Pseudogymnoascus sp. VKM F-4514 (FW-929)]|nr:hypothetical protein V495_02515 [Pseudogymnoascus sp. VKM F-4514 (FW-929)]KFY67800.1 hypothetical protein V497_00212 [Pseudogymnoascus sp. VKM F-4516 (FW-969)]